MTPSATILLEQPTSVSQGPVTMNNKLNFKPSSNFLTDHSMVLLLLWIFYVICVSCLSVMLCCLFLAADHLALVCDVLLCICHFPMQCPGSGVVIDCIYS